MGSNRKSVFGQINRRAKVLLATSIAGTMFASSCNLNDAIVILESVDAVASQLVRGNNSNIGGQILDELNRIF